MKELRQHLTYLTCARMPTEKAHGVSIAHMCAAFAAEGALVELVIPTRRNQITEDIFSYYGVPQSFSVRSISSIDFVGRGWTHPLFFFIQRLLFVYSARHAGIAPGIIYTREPEIAAAFATTHRVIYEAHRWPRGFAGWLTALLIRKVALVVCNSHGTESAVRKAGIPQTIVAPNGFDPTLFAQPVPERSVLGLPEGVVALYVGSDAPWKGIGVVREAARKLDVGGVSVAIVGNGTLPHRDGSLVELGRIAPHRVPAYLRSADILLLPNTKVSEESERFTSPIKLFEYLAAGKAIIASDLPSIREILGPENALFVPPGDARALAEAIQKLANDDTSRAKLAKRSCELALRYTWRARAELVLGATRRP